MRKRHHKRIPLVRYFEVMDIRTGTLFGYLGNISLKGALVYADRPTDMNDRRLLPMSVAVPNLCEQPISVTARKAWTSYDTSTKLHSTGFEFEGVTEAMRREIKAFLKRFRCRS